MYFLDITTLLHILQTHAHTGFLRAHLPRGVAAVPEARAATVTVVKGGVTSCAIFTPDGSLVETGDTAYTMLAHTGRLDWTLTLQLTSSLLPPPPARTGGKGRTLIPRRLVEPSPEQRKTWTRHQRLVFALVNGKNSVTYIAYLLSLSPTRVEQALTDLYQMQVVLVDRHAPSPLAASTPTHHLWPHQHYSPTV